MEPSESEPLEVEAVPPEPPPMVQAVRPGPGILMALVWWLLLLVAQIPFSVIAAVIVMIIAVVTRGPQSINAAMQGGDTMLLDVPGAGFLYLFFGTLGVLLTGAAVTGILYRARAPRVLALCGLSLSHAALIVLMAPAMMMVGWEVQSLAMRVLPNLNLNGPLYEKLGQQPWAAILLAGCLLPGLGEELFFRAFLGRGLVARHGVVLGTFLAAGLFGAMHLDPPQVVGTALLGVAFQFTFLCTKSLFASVLFHAMNNAMAFGLMRLSSDPQLQQVFGSGDDALLPPLLVVAALTSVLTLGWLLYEMRTQWVLPDGRIWSPGYVTAEMPPAHLAATAKRATPRVIAILAAIGGLTAFVAALAWELRALWNS